MRMPGVPWEFIEAECLRRCRARLGCSHLEAVKIERIKPVGRGPNWQIAAFKPELSQVALAEAMREIAKLRSRFTLAPTARRHI